MGFDALDLHGQLLNASDVALQAHDVGVVVMDAAHRVVFCDEAEAALSGVSAERELGRHFFTELAPSTNGCMVARRFEGDRTLDATIDDVSALRMRPTPETPRLLPREGEARGFLVVRRG